MHTGNGVIVYKVNLMRLRLRLSLGLLLWRLLQILITRMHCQGTPLFNIFSVDTIAIYK